MATIEEIQRRVNRCKTNKQRAMRLKQLRQLSKAQDGFVHRDDAIEAASLFLALRVGMPVPVELVVEQMKKAFASGRLTGHNEH